MRARGAAAWRGPLWNHRSGSSGWGDSIIPHWGASKPSTSMIRREAYLAPEEKEWLGTESNRRHKDFQSSALPTELPSRCSAGRQTS